jgi:hypothetical protein
MNFIQKRRMILSNRGRRFKDESPFQKWSKMVKIVVFFQTENTKCNFFLTESTHCMPNTRKKPKNMLV